ncbi:MAG: sigma-54-dependent Fis family transcriptional regulator [Chlorobi bacterium]|nr:sigma-54-dependent Fis family transcriptional regulator [Chlorobiota bacterium]
MTHHVLIVDDEKDIREPLGEFLDGEGFLTLLAADANEAMDKMFEYHVDTVISDIRLPGKNGLELMRDILNEYPETSFIIMTAYASVDSAVEALRAGAFDYMVKPVDFSELLHRLKRIMEHRVMLRQNMQFRKMVHAEEGFHEIIGNSRAMKQVIENIRKVAGSNGNVLLTGESGTGKELVAKAIHFNSPRKNNVFLPVNSSAISPNLIESELFGHKKGSFTDAVEDREGMFQAADGGTIFLDEIAEISMPVQAKLLRAIEEKEIRPVGSAHTIQVDVRIIAATHRNLEDMIRRGTFREDLFYRLNVVEIHLPGLDERREDIPLLVQHFIKKFNREMHHSITGVSNSTMQALMAHRWKGGVRELENIIERAMIFCDGEVITMEDLPPQFLARANISTFTENLKESLRAYERRHIISILGAYPDKREAARVMGIGLSSLYRKIEEHRITPGEIFGQE